jgi:hypothetical protein
MATVLLTVNAHSPPPLFPSTPLRFLFLSGIQLNGVQITEAVISEHLSTARMCTSQQEPDLLIRTSGEMRLSNFLLWELAYTELYFSDKNWPDFTVVDLEAAFSAFSQRDRTYGARPSPSTDECEFP